MQVKTSSAKLTQGCCFNRIVQLWNQLSLFNMFNIQANSFSPFKSNVGDSFLNLSLPQSLFHVLGAPPVDAKIAG